MSLAERARKADACQQETDLAGRDLARLKSQVMQIVSADDIATILSSNPERARNEVRSAARRAFQDPVWALANAEERERLVEDLIDAIFGFGPIEELIEDEDVTEVMVNGTASVFFEKGGKLYPAAQSFSSAEEIRALVDRILGPLGRRVDESSPMVNARLPQGHRVNVVVPPLSLVGPVVTIRKFKCNVMTLEEMERAGSFDRAVRLALKWAVRLRKNIAVSGGTGSGKTTLLNALSCEIPKDERIITIEDSAELRFLEHPHVVGLEARPKNAEGLGEVTIRDLVINSLRMRPDRIVVGECRGAEALDMLQAMNTGHDGSLTTLHANSPTEVISRLETMVRYAADLPVDVVDSYIASAFDVVVQTERSSDGSRFVSAVAAMSYDKKRRVCDVDVLFERKEGQARGVWLKAPAWVKEAVSRGIADEKEARGCGQWMCCS